MDSWIRVNILKILVEMEDPSPIAAAAAGAAGAAGAAAAGAGGAAGPAVGGVRPAFLARVPGNHPAGVYGGDPLVRARVYNHIQSQLSPGAEYAGAMYNDLKCTVCRNIFGLNSDHPPLERRPITLTCGHTFCKGCMKLRASCITCDVPFRVPIREIQPSGVLESVVARIIPESVGRERRSGMVAASGAEPRAPQRKSRRKNKSRRIRK